MEQRLALALNELISLIRDIGTVYDLNDVLDHAADTVSKVLPADRVSIIILNPEERTVEYFCRGGVGADEVVTVSFDELKGGLTGWVLEHQSSALSPSSHPDPRESPEAFQRRKDTHVGAIIVVPLTLGGVVRGTMTALNRPDQREFTADDVRIMEIVGNFCSTAFSKALEVLKAQQSSAALETANLLLKHEADLKTKLFSILAHDLRGPIGNVRSALNMLVDGTVEGGDDRDQLLALTAESADRAFGLTENVLTWIQNQLSPHEVRHTEVSLAACAEQVVTWLGPLADKKSIHLVREVDPSHVLRGDAGSVATIVRNLVSNAIKFSPPRSTITLRSVRADSGTGLEVLDQGVGMSPEKVAQLLTPSKNETTAGTSGEAGSGLGLMFCWDLARSFGGLIEIESAQGLGSVFRLVVPSAQPASDQTRGDHDGF